MARCLFTDAELDGDTKVEHTIQRALGGRVRSKEVISSDFNELCGQRVDPYFSGIYAETMRALGPCLTAEARSASERFKIAGQDGWWVIDEQGRLILASNVVLSRGADGRPLSVIGPSLEALQPMIEQLGSPSYRLSRVLPQEIEVISPERAMLDWRVEVAAMKAVMLTFEHLLKDDSARFTRSAALAPARRFIRAVVEANSDGTPTEPLAEYSLGLQHDQDYLDLYEKLRTDAGLPSQPFRHTVIVSANYATRTLDAVFWAFETDPHAFRLTRDWQEGTFTHVMSNGILAGQEASAPVLLPQGRLLGRYNIRRNRMVAIPLNRQDQERAGTEIMDRRMALYQRAVDHVERTNDASVSGQLGRLAMMNCDGDHRLSSAVFTHLTTLFAFRMETEAKTEAFIAIVSPILDGAGNDTLPAGTLPETAPTQGWPYWVARYRQCLDALREPFGLPGRIFRAGSRTAMNTTPISD